MLLARLQVGLKEALKELPAQGVVQSYMFCLAAKECFAEHTALPSVLRVPSSWS
jgi:hypothetical protein